MAKIIIKSIMDVNGVIGINGDLPWGIPEDLKEFKSVTIGKPMIMGRKTFESLKGFLPNRTHVVITRNKDFKLPHPHKVVHSIEDAMAHVMHDPVAYVIGGGDIYTQSLPFADEIDLTLIQAKYKGDTFFPPLKLSDWELMSSKTTVFESGVTLTKILLSKIDFDKFK